jgi:type II secretory ATPase GspE/PulE/Tfp pilus assembly ATPase PilB-like protein
MSQRLVRQLCPQCKVPISIDEKIARWLPPGAKEMPRQIFGAKGCKACRDTGFLGRFPIVEVLVPNDTIRDFILNGRSDREIMNVAQQSGMKLIFEDGMDRVLQGLTTFEEVTRVVAPPQPPSKVEKKKVSLLKVQEKG